MKARYFPDVSVLDAMAKKQQSYGWSLILTGLKLLKKGVRVIVGDGSTIRVNVDTVIVSHPPRPVSSVDPNYNGMLSTFIHSADNTKSWNTQTIVNFIKPTDVQGLTQIYIPQSCSRDKIVWHYNSSGEYTIRSGYWLATHDPTNLVPAPDIPHGSIDLKNWLWKLQILPKIKHFLWNVLSKSLGTATRLISHGVKIDKMCQRCKQSDETINHTLFTCPSAQLVWDLVNIPTQSPFHVSDHELNVASLFNIYNDQSISREQNLLPLWLIWNIWKDRNNYIFNNILADHHRTLSQSKAEAFEWLQSLSFQPQHLSSAVHTQNPHWVRPLSPMVKCNFDVSYMANTKPTIGGWIVRNNEGMATHWGSSVLRAANNSLEGEAEALLLAIQQTANLGIHECMF